MNGPLVSKDRRGNRVGRWKERGYKEGGGGDMKEKGFMRKD